MAERINITLSDKMIYSVIIVSVAIFISVGVNAFGGSTPNSAGHVFEELILPEDCSDGEILKIYNSLVRKQKNNNFEK